MEQAIPAIFDLKALRANRARALAAPLAMPGFLNEAMADEILWRIQASLKHFPALMLIGADDALARQLAQTGKAGTIQRADTVPRPDSILIDPDNLPFAAHSLDAVIWPGGLEYLNDPAGALIQLRHALKPDGLLIACVWAGDTLIELRQSWLAAESEMAKGASPRVFPFAEIRAWGGLLQRAGFALPVADIERLNVTYGSPLTLMRELKAMGLQNALQARRKTLTPPSLLARAASHYAETFGNASGRMKATFEMVVLTGWAPDESQPKPLKPGSAKARLADALQVRERKL